jgi:hypothetical protein
LYGGATAVGSTSLCASLVLGFLSCLLLLRAGVWLDYCGQNLSKKGWLGFSPIWGYPRINIFCSFVSCLCCYYISVQDIFVNLKEEKEHW